MTPSERVTQFLAAMTDWEQKTFVLRLPRAEMGPVASALSRILEEHLTDKGRAPNRWGMRAEALNSGSPPQYDQEVISSEQGPNRSTHYVYTKHRTLPNTRWRYSVVESKGDSRIDDLRVAYVEGGKWTSGLY